MAALLAAACREREERQAERVAAEALAAERTTAQRVTAERLAAVRGEVSGDEPRDSANRPPAPLGATASRWRPFRIHRAVATPQGLVFSHDGPTDETALSIAATGRPDRRLLTLPTTHIVIPLAADDRFVYVRHLLPSGPDDERPAYLRRVPLAGGAAEELGRDPGLVAVARDWIYWSTGGGRTVSAALSTIVGRHRRGGATVTLRDARAETAMGMAVIGDRLYVVVHDQPARALDLPPARLLAVDLAADGAVAAGAALTEQARMDADRPLELVAVGDALYYSTEGAHLGVDGTLRRWDPTTRAGEMIATGLAFPDSLTATAGYLCFGLMRAADVREVECLRRADGRLVLVHRSPSELLPYLPVTFGDQVLWSQADAAGDETVSATLP